MASLEHFFRPRGVAFIGATEDPSKLGGRRYRSLVEDGFKGAIYPVHPSATHLRGLRVYRSILDVPDPLDLAVIVVPTNVAPAIVAECAQRRVPAVLMVTAGFGEVDDDGRWIEQEMVQTLAAAGSRMLGPNTSGLFDAQSNLNVGGSKVPRGAIGLISQSGNLLLDFNQHARERGFGFSRQATLGNAADLTAADLLGAYLTDPNTRVVLAYLEGWGEHQGRVLFNLIRTHGGSKPIVLLKPGRSVTGRRAVKSHTGTLAGEERVVDAALRQCGVVRANNIEEAWDLAAALCESVLAIGERVAVVSDGGGHSSVLCDALGQAGFSVPVFSDLTQAALAAFLPARSNVSNPVDFAGVVETDPSVLPRAVKVCLSSTDVDSVIVAGHFGGYHKIGGAKLESLEIDAAHALATQARNGRTLLVHSIYANEQLSVYQLLRGAGIPVLRSPEATAALLAGLRQSGLSVARRTVKTTPLSAPDRAAAKRLCRYDTAVVGGQSLLEPQARALIATYGIPVPDFTVVSDSTACAQAVETMGVCALKVIAKGVIHRTEVGGVCLNVSGGDQARASYTTLIDALPENTRETAQILVTAMITTGFEFIMGAFRDTQFGPVVMFGVGGITVEAVSDVTFRLAPLALHEAEEMIGEIGAQRLLHGFRGQPPANRAAAAQILVRLGEILIDLPEVTEIDLNPVFLDHRGARVADARVILDA